MIVRHLHERLVFVRLKLKSPNPSPKPGQSLICMCSIRSLASKTGLRFGGYCFLKYTKPQDKSLFSLESLKCMSAFSRNVSTRDVHTRLSTLVPCTRKTEPKSGLRVGGAQKLCRTNAGTHWRFRFFFSSLNSW